VTDLAEKPGDGDGGDLVWGEVTSAEQVRGVRLRSSLAVRITALVIVLLAAAFASAGVMVSQLRGYQASFDRLTEIYVVFNQRLADAHVQAVRVHEQIRTHQKRNEEPGSSPDPAFLSAFGEALNARNAGIAKAREPIDDALREPERYGGEEQLEELRGIQSSLDELETLAALDEMVDPLQVLLDIQTQNQITQQFRSLGSQSTRAVEDLRDEVRRAQVEAERLTLGLTLVTTVLGVLVTIGVFLTLRPLRRLSDRVRNLGRGDWTQRVELPQSRRGDEVAQLATEFNLMAAALEERERRLLRGERLAAAGQLAAQITHEIRNPLSSVGLNVELLEDELHDASPEALHLLAEITKEVDRLTAITEDYLSFARRPRPELGRLDLAAELLSLLEFMRPELEAAGVALTTDLEERIEVLGDSNQLRQAFMNLLRNALEAALDEEAAQDGRIPRVSVTLRCKDGRASVVVQDNGPGISLSPNELDRIFEAFYTSKARGTGLGLPTVQGIAADHDGTVRVASTGPMGTEFEVVLPACAPGEASVGSQPTA
jgi:two-component system, NtrC family, sensor kinase